MTIPFMPWPKISRLNRTITITEKIDGTNAAVVIVKEPWGPSRPDSNRIAIIGIDSEPLAADGLPEFEYHVYAQSRNKFITPGKSTDNYGFAGWVKENAEALVATLGEGTHFGEWWGSGIQRGYGLPAGEKCFSLFNTARWGTLEGTEQLVLSGIPNLFSVPVLYIGPFSQVAIESELYGLDREGSVASPDFGRAEGVVIFHHASREMYKVTIEGDEAPKGTYTKAAA